MCTCTSMCGRCVQCESFAQRSTVGLLCADAYDEHDSCKGGPHHVVCVTVEFFYTWVLSNLAFVVDGLIAGGGCFMNFFFSSRSEYNQAIIFSFLYARVYYDVTFHSKFNTIPALLTDRVPHLLSRMY